MSYVKTQWVNGDTITADKLNHIEAGIEANETENSLLKSHLEDTDAVVYPYTGALLTKFVQGGINADGTTSSPQNRIRTEPMKLFDSTKIMPLINSDSYKFSYAFYGTNSTDSYISDGHTPTNANIYSGSYISVPAGANYVIIIIARTNEGYIYPSDMNQFVVKLLPSHDLSGLYADVSSIIYPEKGASYKKGVYGAAGGLTVTANGASSGIINLVDALYIDESAMAVLLLYSDGVYVGKINSTGGVDKIGGNWGYFSGLVDIRKILNANNCDGVAFSLIPQDSTTIADDTAAAIYAANHVEFSNVTANKEYVDARLSVLDEYTNFVIGSDLQKKAVKLVRQAANLTYKQSFCIYDGCFYSFDGNGHMAKQNASLTLISTADVSVGHANVCQLGNGAYAWVSGMSDNTVYKVSLETMAVLDSISLPATGVTNAVVDEDRGLMYLFNRTDDGLSVAPHNFIVYDYINDSVVSTTKTHAFSAMQDCDYYKNLILIQYGLGTNASPNGLDIYTTNGDCIASYVLGSALTVEPEGVAVDRATNDLYYSNVGNQLFKIINAL